MSKKGGGGNFNNRAARRFKQLDKVDLMSQSEIFDIMDEDIGTILDQVTKNRNHQGPYPQYVMNGFGNLSTVLWIKRYVKSHVRVKKSKKKGKLITDLSKDDVISLKTIIADAFKKSVTNFYQNQIQEFKERNVMLGETFVMLDPKNYRLAKKLNDKGESLDEKDLQELIIQVFGDPVNNAKFVHRIFNMSPVSDKKKLKILKKMYRKRFTEMVGAMFTVTDNKSDCIEMLYQYVCKMKKKDRAPFILAYAQAYKKNKTSNFRLVAEGIFYDKNKDIFKEMAKYDIGLKKSFKNLKKKDKTKAKEKKADRESVEITLF